MGFLTSTVYDNDTPDGTTPSKDPRTIGAGFVQQTILGTRHVDPFDDRVTYEASIYSSVPQAVSTGLGNDLDASGVQLVPFLQAPNPTNPAGNQAPYSQVDAFQQNVGSGGSFSETDWRPNAGFPLNPMSDAQWTATTGDTIGLQVNQDGPTHVAPGVRNIMERSIGYEERLPEMPSSQAAWRPWDTLMGAWPWTGDKSAQRPPLATQPFNTDTIIDNSLPSPTGAGGPVGMRNELEVRPLTFRLVPQPWDTGIDGAYVDAGT